MTTHRSADIPLFDICHRFWGPPCDSCGSRDGFHVRGTDTCPRCYRAAAEQRSAGRDILLPSGRLFDPSLNR